jgi:hypothetical protein
MSFFAYITQIYEGCDYTIGCGKLLLNLNGSTLQQALQNLKTQIQTNYTGDKQLESILLIEGNSISIDTLSIYNEINKENQNLQKQQLEHQELLEFERLKKKFN